MSTVDDVSPDGLGTNGTIAVGGSVTGVLERSDDQDWFAVTLEAGTTYRIDLEGAGANGGLNDPLVLLMNAGGVEIAQNDDGGPGRNSSLPFTAERSGQFFIVADNFLSSTGEFKLSLTVPELAVTPEQMFEHPTPSLGGKFGSSVSLDENTVLIGSPWTSNDNKEFNRAGQAHLFDTLTGDLLQTFDDPTPGNNFDEFGTSAALDGDRVLIGAPFDDTLGTNVGQAYLFNTLTGDLLQTFDDPTLGNNFDEFGTSVALDGDRVLIGAPFDDTLGTNVGQTHLFDATTGNLLQSFNDPTPGGGDQFGTSVALYGDLVLIGAPLDSTDFQTRGANVGQAHLFDATTGNLLQTFDDPSPQGGFDGVSNGDRFGTSVALDGDRVLIGAPFDDTLGNNVGQTHLFDATTGNLLRTFDDPTPSRRDSFGTSVALDGDNVLISAPGDDSQGTNVGQAHLFDATTGNLLQTINNPDPSSTGTDLFGSSVTLNSSNVIIGEERGETEAATPGRAHLFSEDLSGTQPRANDDSAQTTSGESVTIDVLANDSDPDSDALSIQDPGSPNNGTVTVTQDGAIRYTPNTGFTGTDSFSYTVSDGNGGTDTGEVKVSVEQFVLFDMPPVDQVTAVYVGYFGRAPDSEGRSFWVTDLNQDLSQGQSSTATAEEMASGFRFSDEAQVIYPFLDPIASQDASEAEIQGFLDDLYGNLFNRTLDEAGAEFWVGEIEDRLDSGQNIGDVIVDVMAGATGSDVATLQNKIEVANAYTESVSTFEVEESIQIIGAVDKTQESVEQAIGQIE